MKAFLRQLLSALVIACAWTGSTSASVVVSGTRVIFPSSEREVTIKVENTGSAPALVQAWLDTGDADAAPDSIEVPFTLTPAMFRLDPAKGQAMRLIYTQEPLAQDRETLFWLNVLEIPPKPRSEPDAASHLQLAIRTRIKVMFRPAGLPGKPNEAPGQVRWDVVQTAEGYRLKATNPTPYHVNLGRIELVSGDRTLSAGAGFIGPGQSEEFAVADLAGRPDAMSSVQYLALNDYGAGVAGQAPLAASPLH